MYLLFMWDTESVFAPRCFNTIEEAETWVEANPLELLENRVLLPAPGLKVLALVDPA